MIKTSEAIRTARALIGTPYSELDCINLIKKVIRTCAGGDKRYTTAGTNALWDSDSKSGRYRDLTWKQEGISGAKPGMLAFMGVGTGDVSHTGLVTERGTVMHSSKSRGDVVETALTEKAGWNGLGEHRMIAVDGEETADSAKGESVTVCAQGGLRMRKKPKERYMQMIPDGAQLAVLEEKDGWLRVEYRGFTGWISGEYCCKAGED
ncbi:MAG: SH3 domain-containing protein [Christensenellales bacterium]